MLCKEQIVKAVLTNLMLWALICIPCFYSKFEFSIFFKKLMLVFFLFLCLLCHHCNLGHELDFICHWGCFKNKILNIADPKRGSSWVSECSWVWIRVICVGVEHSLFSLTFLRHLSCWSSRSTQWQWTTGVLGLWCSSASLVSDPFCQTGSLYPGTIYFRLFCLGLKCQVFGQFF